MRKKVRLKGEEVMFHKLEIKFEIVNVVKVNVKLKELLGHLLMSTPSGWSGLGTFLVLFSDGTSQQKVIDQIYDFPLKF